MKTEEYIKNSWYKTIKDVTTKGHGDIKLIKPYSVPSIGDFFCDFYYWDTFFINIGLIEDGLTDQAINNLDNIDYLIRMFGFMPNASHLLNHSQPPLYSFMIMYLYDILKDKEIISKYINSAVIEYNFYQNERMTEIGLNQYNAFVKDEILDDTYDYASNRLGVYFDDINLRRKLTKCLFAICESGWDTSPRWLSKENPFMILDLSEIDLNSLLYGVELNISRMYEILGNISEAQKYLNYSIKRKELIEKYMHKGDIYLDYDLSSKGNGIHYSLASFYPYFVGLSKDKKEVRKLLKEFEFEYGISTGVKEKENKFQWDYPIMWAPMVYIVYVSLIKVGLIEDAKRVGIKYLNTVDKCFNEKGLLFEKYDVLTGMDASLEESESHEMLGWTAGVYVYLNKRIER